MSKPVLIAIVGRPNVGKSTLFNALLGEQRAIVYDEAGTTRDVLVARMELGSRRLLLADTAGLASDFGAEQTIEQEAMLQTKMAIADADAVVMLVENGAPLSAEEENVARLLRKGGRPVLLVVNKCDSGLDRADTAAWWSLGLGEPLPMAAKRRLGLDALKERLVQLLDEAKIGGEDAAEADLPGVPKVALLGRPNVGKSSLYNKLFGRKVTTVSDVAGTTRDAIDTLWTGPDGQQMLLIDTAGLRRLARLEKEDHLERFSILRTVMAVERADVVLMVLDGSQAVSRQDQRLLDLALQAHKGVVIVATKWDIVQEKWKDEEARGNYMRHLQRNLAFGGFAPVVFTSGITGQHLRELPSIIAEIYRQRGRKWAAGDLCMLLDKAIVRQAPVNTMKRREVRFIAIEQVGSHPPAVQITVNDRELLHGSYKRYLENSLRESLELYGTELVVYFTDPRREREWREKKGTPEVAEATSDEAVQE